MRAHTAPDAQQAPTLTFAGLDPAKSYMVICLDLDAPFPSFPKLGPILHWVQTGFTVSADGTNTLTTTTPFIADYIGPAPPPGSAPHRYSFYLYEEPAGLDPKPHAPPGGAKLGPTKRMWASLDDWEAKLKLGPVLAANYFKSN